MTANDAAPWVLMISTVGYGLVSIIQAHLSLREQQKQTEELRKTNQIMLGTMMYAVPRKSRLRVYLPSIVMLAISIFTSAVILSNDGHRGDAIWVLTVFLLVGVIAVFVPAIIRLERWSKPRADLIPSIPDCKSPFSGPSEELIGQMDVINPPKVKIIDGVYELRENGKLTTKKFFKPPIAFRLIAKTNTNNIRMKFVAHQIILGWEVDENDNILKFGGGLIGDRRVNGQGWIPSEEWVVIDIFAYPDRFAIVVNDSLRFSEPFDLRLIDEPFTIRQGFNSVVSVFSLKAGPPRHAI